MDKHIDGLLLKKYGILQEIVITERDDGKATTYCDKPIKTDRKVSYNRPDVVVIDRKENTCYTGDFVIRIDHHVKEKEEENIAKYMDLGAEVRRQFRVKTVIVPIAPRALATVPAKLSKSLKKLEIEDVIVNLQTAVLISTRA